MKEVRIPLEMEIKHCAMKDILTFLEEGSVNITLQDLTALFSH